MRLNLRKILFSFGDKSNKRVAAIANPLSSQRVRMSRLAELSIKPDSYGPVDQPFLLGAAGERLGRSVAASLASHVFGVGLFMLLLSLVPERVYEMVPQNQEGYGILWLSDEGPGGGGGGGGNESLVLPQQVEVQGLDQAELSLPVEEPEPVDLDVEVQPEPEPIEAQELRMPAISMAAAPETRAGVLEELMASMSLSQGSGLGGGAGSGEGTGIGPGQGSGVGPGIGGGVGGGFYRPGAGIENPKLILEVKPRYTPEAMRAKVQGSVWLEVVIGVNGTVDDIRVTKSLDTIFGLDEEAIRAAKQWQFLPGTRFGQPVAVLVGIELSFTLR